MPAANPGHTLAVLKAVAVPLFLVMAVGKITSSLQPPAGRAIRFLINIPVVHEANACSVRPVAEQHGPLAGGSHLTIWFLQRACDVISERGRHLRGGRDDPAKPGHGGNR